MDWMWICSWHILESGLVFGRAPKSVQSQDILYAIEKVRGEVLCPPFAANQIYKKKALDHYWTLV